MKNIFMSAFVTLVLASCRQESKEVKIDETKVETPADNVVKKDTLATAETEPQIESENSGKPKPNITGKETPKAADQKFTSFGSKITADHALDKNQMLKKYESLKKGDTVAMKFTSNISSVCKKKGCWMKMDLADNKESFVRFKDYSFFVPLNADNSKAIVSGRAYLDVISVDELKHYAKDGGKPREEIDKITSPKITYAFQADGVLIAE